MKIDTNIIIFCVSAFLIIIYFQYICRYIETYKITGKGVEIREFGFFVSASFDYNNIEDIKIALQEEVGGFSVFKGGNRLVGNNPVLIKLRKRFGFYKKILITPDKPEEFVEKVKWHINNKQEL